jgi:hypothetical protein
MKVILKLGVLILVPETVTETADLHGWKAATAGHVLFARQDAGEGLALMDIGAKPDACNEPIQVSSMVKDPAIQLTRRSSWMNANTRRSRASGKV